MKPIELKIIKVSIPKKDEVLIINMPEEWGMCEIKTFKKALEKAKEERGMLLVQGKFGIHYVKNKNIQVKKNDKTI